MRTPTEVVKELNQSLAMIDRENGPIPIATRAGIEGAINRAKAQAPLLWKELGESLMANGTALFLEGEKEKVEEFKDIVRKEGGGQVVVYDANEFYVRLAHNVWPSLKVSTNNEFVNHETLLLISGLSQIARELDWNASITNPVIKNARRVLDFDDLVAYTKELVDGTDTGLELSSLFVKRALAKQAVGNSYAGGDFGVIVVNTDNNTKQRFKSNFKNTLELTLKQEKITKEFIEKQLRLAKKQKEKEQK